MSIYTCVQLEDDVFMYESQCGYYMSYMTSFGFL